MSGNPEWKLPFVNSYIEKWEISTRQLTIS